MVPEKPVLGRRRKSIGKVAPWRNGVLCNTWHTIHVGSSSLQESMPVDGGLDIQVVLDKNFDIVPFIHVDQRPRLLAINEVHFALESIWRVESAVNGEIELA